MSPRGAGRAGGLLFVALVLALAYLTLTGLEGPAGLVASAVLVVAAGLLLATVVRRR